MRRNPLGDRKQSRRPADSKRYSFYGIIFLNREEWQDGAGTGDALCIRE